MEKTIRKYKDIRKKIMAFQYAMYVIHWDSATEAPKGCFEYRGKQVGILSEEIYKLQTSEEYVHTVNELCAHTDQLDDILHHEVIEIKKGMDKLRKIPMEEYVQFRMLLASSQEIWANAKIKGDFSLFKPTLTTIVGFMRKYVTYLETDEMKGYDILLNDYEPGFTRKEYDAFFDLLKEKLVPFYKQLVKKPLVFNQTFASKQYAVESQKRFLDYIQDVFVFNRHHGLMKESEHPFTSGSGSSDVRFTVHYYENELTSAIFSAIHELGHATYEQQSNPALDETFSSGGASMAMHESQSRLYENMIGRSYEFWNTHFSKLKETFPTQMENTTVEDFYRFINTVEASYIRTEADELTYPLHIMLRYDIENMLVSGTLEVDDLEATWNRLFYDYFGIRVEDVRKGVLQDVHWSAGMFGYFPTYALGSAYSAQIYQAMNKELKLNEVIGEPTLQKVNEWLKLHIHDIGSTQYPKEILLNATKEAFNPQYYIDYLINKYTKIYQL